MNFYDFHADIYYQKCCVYVVPLAFFLNNDHVLQFLCLNAEIFKFKSLIFFSKICNNVTSQIRLYDVRSRKLDMCLL